MNQSLLFRNGYKPGFLVTSIDNEYYDLVDHYYYIDFINKRGSYNRLFFQNYNDYLNFKDTLKYEDDIYYLEDYDYEIGIALGFPPFAVDYYIEKNINKDHPKYAINYHDIQFVVREDDIDSAIRWMNEHYNIPEDFKSGVFLIDLVNQIQHSF